MAEETDIVADFLENSRESVSYGLTAGRMQGKLTASIDFLVGAASLMVLFVGGYCESCTVASPSAS